MKICIKCNSEIINIKIDGKHRNLQSRKYCLSCSPFGNHNTKKNIDQETMRGKLQICSTCGKQFLYKHKGDRMTKCGTCCTTSARKNLKKRCVEYKGGSCEKCSYNRCISALEFHHIDPTKKDFGIGDGSSRKWDSLKIELDKCLMLCANCHREIHHKE